MDREKEGWKRGQGGGREEGKERKEACSFKQYLLIILDFILQDHSIGPIWFQPSQSNTVSCNFFCLDQSNGWRCYWEKQTTKKQKGKKHWWYQSIISFYLRKMWRIVLSCPDFHVSLPQHTSIAFLWFSPICWYKVCLRKIISEEKAYSITSTAPTAIPHKIYRKCYRLLYFFASLEIHWKTAFYVQ